MPRATKNSHSFGDQLRERRTALGWSWYRLAKTAGIRHETVKAIEHGQRPHRGTRELLERVLAGAEGKQ